MEKKKDQTQKLVIAFGVGALVYLALMAFLPYPGAFLLKAYPIWCLALLAWQRVPGATGKLLALGFLLSSGGDIALTMNTELAFMIGLGFFLSAHIIYTIAFSQKMRFERQRLPFFILVVGLAVAMGFILAPHLGSMAIPVYAYLLVITTMAVFSGLRADASPLLMLGGLVFMASDTMLAIAKFIAPFPSARYDIMITYYVAQFLIVWAFVRPSAADPSANAFSK